MPQKCFLLLTNLTAVPEARLYSIKKNRKISALEIAKDTDGLSHCEALQPPLPRASQELSLKDALTRSELNISKTEGHKDMWGHWGGGGGEEEGGAERGLENATSFF